MSFSRLPIDSFYVEESRPQAHAAERILKQLVRLGASVQRDVTIGGDDEESLTTLRSPLPVHSDGAYLELPPRWLVIQVLESSGGGALRLRSTVELRKRFLGRRANFALPHQNRLGARSAGVPRAIAERASQWSYFRYRRDVMTQVSGDDSLDDVHAAVTDAASSSIELGEIDPGTAVVVDNWAFLHSRDAYAGRRVIRRIWLT